MSVWRTRSYIVWISQTSVNPKIRENIAKAASKWNIDFKIVDKGIMQEEWLKMYNHTKELARKRDQQQQQQDDNDSSSKPGEIPIERQGIDDNDDKEEEEEETSTDSECSQRSGGEADDECANFIREVISNRPSTEAVRDENHIFSRKKSTKRRRGNRRPILGTRGKWIKFLGLNDKKLTRAGKFVTTDQLAKQFSGGRVTTRGAARKRKNEEEEEEEEEVVALPEKKKRRKRRKRSTEEEGKEEEEEEEEEKKSEEAASATEEGKGKKRDEEEEVEITEEEEARGGDEGYKSKRQSSPPAEASHANLLGEPVTVEQARKKINEAQENEEINKTRPLPVGSLVSEAGGRGRGGQGQWQRQKVSYDEKLFLGACDQSTGRVHRSVGWSVGRSVGRLLALFL